MRYNILDDTWFNLGIDNTMRQMPDEPVPVLFMANRNQHILYTALLAEQSEKSAGQFSWPFKVFYLDVRKCGSSQQDLGLTNRFHTCFARMA